MGNAAADHRHRVIRGLDPPAGRSRFGAAKARVSITLHEKSLSKEMDGRVICAKTRFAL